MYDYKWERALGYDSWDRSAMGGVCLTTKFCDPGGHEDLAGQAKSPGWRRMCRTSNVYKLDLYP